MEKETLRKVYRFGKKVLYETPFRTREIGVISFPPPQEDYILVKPQKGGSLQLIHKLDIVALLPH